MRQASGLVLKLQVHRDQQCLMQRMAFALLPRDFSSFLCYGVPQTFSSGSCSFLLAYFYWVTWGSVSYMQCLPNSLKTTMCNSDTSQFVFFGDTAVQCQLNQFELLTIVWVVKACVLLKIVPRCWRSLSVRCVINQRPETQHLHWFFLILCV